jgi:hypothetical protein
MSRATVLDLIRGVPSESHFESQTCDDDHRCLSGIDMSPNQVQYIKSLPKAEPGKSMIEHKLCPRLCILQVILSP